MYKPINIMAMGSNTTSPVIDPYWANVVLLLQGDSISDRKGRHSVAILDGTPAPSDGYINFPGTSSLEVTDNLSDFSYPGEFTWEFLINAPAGDVGTQVLMSNFIGDIPPGSFEVFLRGTNGLGIYTQDGFWQEPSGDPISGSPVHLAISRDDTNTLRMYIAGEKLYEGIYTGTLTPSPELQMVIGREGTYGNKYYVGGMKLRLTKGVARYTGETHPVLTEFPTS